MYQYRWTAMKTGANTWGHSDRKMLCPALPTDSCDSWIEAWREKNSHLQLAPISPAELPVVVSKDPCSFWPKSRNPTCFILPLPAGLVVLILPLTALILLHAQKQGIGCQPLPVSRREISLPQIVFPCWLPLSGEQQHAHCYPTLPCQMVLMWATQMSEHELLLALFQ